MYKKILVPLDGSELAECVLPHLEAIAKGCNVSDVTLVRTWELFRQRGDYNLPEDQIKRINSDNKAAAIDYLDGIVTQLKKSGITAKSVVFEGRAAEVIAEYATKVEADLIIMSTHGRSGVSRWVMGSVADRLLRSACVPVLMVRAPGCIAGI